ncbi:MAG TPA: hypothetical protein VLC52_01405 [Anaerolineae bacterium]|nr:hypothetical protein [Anaerolineae bacterium]
MIVKVSPRTRWFWALLATMLVLPFVLSACSLSPSGEELVTEDCTPCHTLAPIQVAGRTEHEWRNVVYRMVGHGADLSRNEAERVIDYLAEAYGPEER